MTERLRELERQAQCGDSTAVKQLDAELWRRGEAIARAPVLKKRCNTCDGFGRGSEILNHYNNNNCPMCFGQGYVIVKETERLRLLAYCGHEEANKVDIWLHPRGLSASSPFHPWLGGLPPWLRTACSLGAARLVWERVYWPGRKSRLTTSNIKPSRDHARCVLDACAAWLRDPTATRREAWNDALRLDYSRNPPWLPYLGESDAIRYACEAYGSNNAIYIAAKAQAIKLLLRGVKML